MQLVVLSKMNYPAASGGVSIPRFAIKKLIALSILMLTLYSCTPQTYVEVSYSAPFIPLVISVNQDGDINASLRGQLITPIGIFEIGAGLSAQTGHRVVIEHIPHNKQTVYDLKGKFDYFKLEKSDGISVKVTSDMTTISLHESKPYSFTCKLKNLSADATPIPYPEPRYEIRYHIALTYFLYDYRILGWTSDVNKWSWIPIKTDYSKSQYEILDWILFLGRWVLVIIWWFLKIIIMIITLIFEILIIPAGFIFYTGWRALPVICGGIAAILEIIIFFSSCNA